MAFSRCQWNVTDACMALKRQPRAYALVLRVLLALCFVGAAHAVDDAHPAVDGTYDILICRGICATETSANVEVKGQLVLLAKPFSHEEVQRLDGMYLPSRAGEEPNGCYRLVKLNTRDYSGYAGIKAYGVTAWAYWRDDIIFSLYQSPDAGYQATLRPAFNGLAGHGMSWGAGVAEPSQPTTENIVARRTGDADVRLCETWSAQGPALTRGR